MGDSSSFTHTEEEDDDSEENESEENETLENYTPTIEELANGARFGAEGESLLYSRL